jgi:hypothetical protein
MQELFKNAIHGLPPWDQRGMALHSSFSVDDLDLDALAKDWSSKDTMLSTEHGGMKHLAAWNKGDSDAGVHLLPPNCAKRCKQLDKHTLTCRYTRLQPCSVHQLWGVDENDLWLLFHAEVLADMRAWCQLPNEWLNMKHLHEVRTNLQSTANSLSVSAVPRVVLQLEKSLLTFESCMVQQARLSPPASLSCCCTTHTCVNTP